MMGEGCRTNALGTRVTMMDTGLNIVSHEKQLKVLGVLNLVSMKDTTAISKYMRDYHKQ